MPVVVPQAVKVNIFPPEQPFVASFIDFPLPSCTGPESAGSDNNITQYFVMLPPDIMMKAAVADALWTLPLLPPHVIKQLSS